MSIGNNPTPTALIDIGSATSNNAQLRLRSSSGVNPSTPNNGDLWWNGNSLFFNNGTNSVDLLDFYKSGGSSGFVQLSPNTAQTDVGSDPLINLQANGNIASSVLQVDENGLGNPNLLSLSVSSLPRFRITNDGKLESYINGVSQAFSISYNTSTLVPAGIVISNSSTGEIINAIDLSDSKIRNAVNIGNNNIQMADNGTVSIVNSSGNQVLQVSDISVNFGGVVESGEVVSRNSYFGEEFSRDRANVVADAVYAWGDYQQFAVDENVNCVFSTVDDAVNGIGRVSVAAAGSSCLAYHGSGVGDPQLQFNMYNLPLVIMKVRPSAVGTGQNFWVGLSTQAFATDSPPLNGVYFIRGPSNVWTGVTTSGGTSTYTSCSGQAISTSQFALLKIETRSVTEVRFYVDANVSDGVQWFECGVSSTNIFTGNMTSLIMSSSTTAGFNLDIDYYRIWQDDSLYQDTTEGHTNEKDTGNKKDSSMDNLEFVTEEITQFELLYDSFPHDHVNEVLAESKGENSTTDTNSYSINGNGEKRRQSEDQNNPFIISEDDGFISITTAKMEIKKVKFEVKSLIFESDLSVDGTVSINGSINVTKDVSIQGKLKLGAQNFVELIIQQNETQVLYNFDGELDTKPFVFVSQVAGPPSNFVITDISKTGFKILLDKPAEDLLKFEGVYLLKH